MSLPPEPPPLQDLQSADALYTRVLARGRRLRRERRAFLLTAGMSLVLLAAAIPVALTNDDPAQLATTDQPTTTRQTTTTYEFTLEPNPNAVTTTTEAEPAPVVAGTTATTARRTTRTTARRSTASQTTTTRSSNPPKPPATPAPATTTTTMIPASDPASACTDQPTKLTTHQILFVRGANVWLVGLAGPVQLTTTDDAAKPAWAPDGTQVVFVRPGGLFTMPPTPGAQPTQLTSVAGDTDPAWSPDGTRIAFVRGGDIFTIRPDKTGGKRVQFESTPLGSPTWSPGSCDLAFTWKTYVLKGRSNDRSGVTQVRKDSSEPAWGPTNRLAVSVSAGLTLVNPDGTAPSAFTNDGGRVATWKPDGTVVAYKAAGGIVSRTVNPVGAPVTVTDQPGDTDPAW